MHVYFILNTESDPTKAPAGPAVNGPQENGPAIDDIDAHPEVRLRVKKCKLRPKKINH